MASRLTVILSQGQSNHPEKRSLEEEIVTRLIGQRGIEITVVPHLYDLKPDGTGVLCMQGISGNFVVLSWLYPRAAHWTLDRFGIEGRMGTSLIAPDEDEDEDAEDASSAEDEQAAPRVVDERNLPNRTIYCLDLRWHATAEVYLEEIERVAAESRTSVVPLSLSSPLKLAAGAAAEPQTGGMGAEAQVSRVDEETARRWYPVIDFSRCTNCMECIDFCLFGVYGVNSAETILVEQPDNCRKGCPACSRVCPENAIIFPQHKSPAIAGSSDVVASLKIDLSKLFGGDNGESAEAAAVRERDEQLLLAGRDAVGAAAIPARKARGDEPRDDLDALMDDLDALEL